jgi:hypothetical protein
MPAPAPNALTQHQETAGEGVAKRQDPRGIVVVLSRADERGRAACHEPITRVGLAERLAALKGFNFGGEYDPARRHPGPVYLVPADTLVAAKAEELGIRDKDDLFGGVVPHPFVATKAITHPLVEPNAAAPDGWSRAFGEQVRDVVLPGFTAFTREDARRAGQRLLERGPVRVKPVRAAGGRGQAVANDAATLEAILATLDPEELTGHGLVLEEELTEVTTYSVGQVGVAGLVATYYGTQRLTPDNRGDLVYGGSDLVVVRGDFAALLMLDLPEEVRLAVAQARAYDTAAAACFPGLLVSRRNYDVAQGLDTRQQRRSGVLEQSWRIGGASGAEIAALEAFRADPMLHRVQASTVEIYGEGAAPPPDATVYFHGVDDQVGPISKYVMVERDADAR